MNIGSRIKRQREALGMSQEELAKKVGYKSRSSINKIEIDGRGLPQSKIVAFAKALETTPAYLMGWEEEELINQLPPDVSYKRVASHSNNDFQPDIIIEKDGLKIYVEYNTRKNNQFSDSERRLLLYYLASASKLDNNQLRLLCNMIDAMSTNESSKDFDSTINHFSTRDILSRNNQDTVIEFEQIPIAAHAENNASAKDKEHDNQIMDDENF